MKHVNTVSTNCNAAPLVLGEPNKFARNCDSGKKARLFRIQLNNDVTVCNSKYPTQLEMFLYAKA